MRLRRGRIVVWLTFQGGLKLALSALLVGLAIYIFAHELPATKTWTYWTMPLSGKQIAIDAGHGGPDGGAKSKDGVIEKDINLAISLYLRDYLQQSGALVLMTREEDRDLAGPDTKGLSKRKTEDLHARGDLIAGKHADLFLSIHMNSTPSGQWRGAQTFYFPNHPDNKELAQLIQDELKRNLGNTDRVAKTVDKSVYLLKTLTMPGALVEVGFLSNPEEARLLADRNYQKKVAASIYQAILRYYSGEKVEAS
ncbi:MAG: N-acetylmuramoyl-L-alanine amidase [Paenibacillaceae bacterium]|jgi:N-acetylmuramoyl-L-alanine amidase|nr:N-acetylmuramoyl-L-alanine amidase [Paenibacillaceae bacterium]